MANNGALIQRIMKMKVEDAMHSSGYAVAQNGGNFGAVDTTTFAERKKIEEQRKFIQGYRNSKIATGIKGMPKAKTYTAPRLSTGFSRSSTISGGSRATARPISNPRFGRL